MSSSLSTTLTAATARALPAQPVRHAMLAAPARGGYGVLMELLLATSVIGLGASFGKVYACHVVLGLILLRSALSPDRGTLFGKSATQSRYHWAFPAAFVWFLLGLAWSHDRTYTAQYLGYVGVGSLLVVAVVNFVRGSAARFQRLFAVARYMFLVDVVAGLLEALTPFRLPISLLSANSLENGDFSGHSAETVAYLDSCPTGFHWNPNNFAVVMVILMPFVIMHRSVKVRCGGAVVLFGLILATSSRASVLAALAVICLSQAYTHGSAWVIRLGAIVGVGVTAGALLLTQLGSLGSQKLTEASEAVSDTIELFTADEDASSGSIGARQQLIRNGLVALINSKGLGIGGGADKALQQTAGVGNTELTAMHNVWVELLVCGGLPFFLPLVIWYGRLSLELFRHSKRLPLRSPLRYYSAAASLAMIGFIPAAVSASSTIYMLPMYLLFGFAIAMANVCRTVEQQARQQRILV